MTREQISEYLKELGIEEPSKALVSGLLNKFNEEKRNTIVETTDKIMNDIKDWKKPEEYQKIVDELNAEKGKGALAERKAKYKEANLNIEDEDVLNLIEGKLKESKDFDKDLAEYVKAHPSFLKAEPEPKEKEKAPAPTPAKKVTIGGTGSDKGTQDLGLNLGDAIAEHYNKNN